MADESTPAAGCYPYLIWSLIGRHSGVVWSSIGQAALRALLKSVSPAKWPLMPL